MTVARPHILLTGATGWLGRGVAAALALGIDGVDLPYAPGSARVRGLALPGTAEPSETNTAEMVRGDIRNPLDCEAFCRDGAGAVLIHTAGIIHPQRIRDFYDINVAGTLNLLRAAVQAGVRRAVIVSSNSPCGCNPHPDHLFDEDSPYQPYMNYGRSKMQLEIEAWAYAATAPLEVVLIRAPWFYGPYQPPRQTLFFRMIRDGKAPIVGDGLNLRSMAYIENLAQGLLLAAAHPQAAGGTYWIADERPYSMNEIVDTVEHLLETEFGQRCAHRRLRLPGIASEVAYAVDAVLQTMGFYHQKVHVLSEMNKTIACTVERARMELGYRPTVDLHEGMRRSLKWLFAQGRGLDEDAAP